MWEACDADIITLSVEHHDSVLAATSHLPHMLAYALVDCLAKMQESEEIFQFAAGGFIDFTRIASSNPQMWHDICFSNRISSIDICWKSGRPSKVMTVKNYYRYFLAQKRLVTS
jgi:prephenate dehydrogenase